MIFCKFYQNYKVTNSEIKKIDIIYILKIEIYFKN